MTMLHGRHHDARMADDHAEFSGPSEPWWFVRLILAWRARRRTNLRREELIRRARRIAKIDGRTM